MFANLYINDILLMVFVLFLLLLFLWFFFLFYFLFSLIQYLNEILIEFQNNSSSIGVSFMSCLVESLLQNIVIQSKWWLYHRRTNTCRIFCRVSFFSFFLLKVLTKCHWNFPLSHWLTPTLTHTNEKLKSLVKKNISKFYFHPNAAQPHNVWIHE